MAPSRALLMAVAAVLCSAASCSAGASSGSAARRILQQGTCSHATSAIFQCMPMSGEPANTPNFTACVNMCPTAEAPCGFCTEGATVCAQVYSANTGNNASFTASMVHYQYGDVCFASPPPPPGVYAPPPLPFPKFPWQSPPPPVLWPPPEIFPPSYVPAPVPAPGTYGVAVASEAQPPPRQLRRSLRHLLRRAHMRRLLHNLA